MGLLALPASVVLFSLAACGERVAEQGAEANPPASAASMPRTESPATEIPLTAAAPAAAPAAFALACLRGDPVEGAPWTLSGVDPTLAPLAFEQIEMLSSRDSARLAARITRAVDVLPGDTTRADFHGLPVVVRAAWRIARAPGDTVVAALVARRLPIESDPREELFFLVAAPGQRQGVRDPLVEGWVVREVANEEEIAVRELVAVLASADVLTLVLTLVLAHDADDGVRIEILSRRSAVWVVDWSGPLKRCAP